MSYGILVFMLMLVSVSSAIEIDASTTQTSTITSTISSTSSTQLNNGPTVNAREKSDKNLTTPETILLIIIAVLFFIMSMKTKIDMDNSRSSASSPTAPREGDSENSDAPSILEEGGIEESSDEIQVNPSDINNLEEGGLYV